MHDNGVARLIVNDITNSPELALTMFPGLIVGLFPDQPLHRPNQARGAAEAGQGGTQ